MPWLLPTTRQLCTLISAGAEAELLELINDVIPEPFPATMLPLIVTFAVSSAHKPLVLFSKRLSSINVPMELKILMPLKLLLRVVFLTTNGDEVFTRIPSVQQSVGKGVNPEF